MLLFALLFGLIIGSFLNAVVYRLPLAIQGQNYSIIHPIYSICPNCKVRLGFLQLIPLLSFAFQHGKCKHCQQKISQQYPIIELLSGLITLWLFVRLGFVVELFFYLSFVYIAIVLALIDYKHQLLPDVLTLGLLYLGLLFYLHSPFLSQSVLGVVAGYLSLWSLYWLFKLVRNQEVFGYGDFKLTAALGAWLGWQSLPILLTIAAILALIFALFKRIKFNQKFGFAPFLLLAATALIFMPKISL